MKDFKKAKEGIQKLKDSGVMFLATIENEDGKTRIAYTSEFNCDVVNMVENLMVAVLKNVKDKMTRDEMSDLLIGFVSWCVNEIYDKDEVSQ